LIGLVDQRSFSFWAYSS